MTDKEAAGPPPPKSAKVVPITQAPNAIVAPAPLPAQTFPYLESPIQKVIFGRNECVYEPSTLVVNIEGQNTIAGMTFDQILGLLAIMPTITRDNFIRMWKTLLLKRVQDVHFREFGVRPPSFIHLAAGLPVPAPLGDLLNAIGGFDSVASGIRTFMSPPALPAAAPPWSQVNDGILATWNAFSTRAMPLYVYRESPAPHDWQNRPLGLTVRHDDGNGMASVRSVTQEPRITDGLLRLIHDDIFDAPVREWNNCGITIVPSQHVASHRYEYIRSYVLRG